MIEISPTQQQSSPFDHDLAVVEYSSIKLQGNSKFIAEKWENYSHESLSVIFAESSEPRFVDSVSRSLNTIYFFS